MTDGTDFKLDNVLQAATAILTPEDLNTSIDELES
jgi:hypothetical protein